jgi:DNA-directed RNA polymerase specialized sigma24 family protein
MQLVARTIPKTLPMSRPRRSWWHGADSMPSQLTVAALDRLRGSDRELLTLTAWDGLDANDLAVVLGCSPATARVRLHRARKHFEQILLSEDGNE